MLRIFVVCQNSIYLFEITKCKLEKTIDTFENRKGLIAVCEVDNNILFAYPDHKKGYVRVKSINNDEQNSQLINAHESFIGCVSLNKDGTLLCTASDKGTVFRVFSTSNGSLMKELRRGAEKAEIFSLSFSHDSRFLACLSDRGTMHVFILKTTNDEPNNANKDTTHNNNNSNTTTNTAATASNNNSSDNTEGPKNQTSVLGKISSFFGKKTGYFNSEWSFAKISIPETKAICRFDVSNDTNSLIVLGYSGKYYQVQFDKKIGGNGRIVQEFKLGL